MSKDGDSVKFFHELCDNKGPTVILTKIKKRKYNWMFYTIFL